MTSRPGQRFVLTVIAETGARFRDFAPYVASINDHGVVAFQAGLRDGHTGVFTGDGGAVAAIADTTDGGFARFYSHPDIDRDGALSVYAESTAGHQGVFVGRAGRVRAAADTAGAFAGIGPLGPTMNDRGSVAFRADGRSGAHGVFTVTGDVIETIADTGRFDAFHGLPVIDAEGGVVFRADVAGGGQGIYRADRRADYRANGSGGAAAAAAGAGGQTLRTIVETGGLFGGLGAFSCVNDAGTVVFSATRKQGGAGIYAVTGDTITPVVEAGDTFESFRGALIDNAGAVLFYATPRGGQLGIYAAREAAAERLLAIGDPLFGSTVTDFALNPVSMNQAGQIAIRIGLASARQLIVRADPVR